QLKQTFGQQRLTDIEDEIEELNINIEVMVASENVLVSVTKEGYVKRTSLRSYAASSDNDPAMKDNDYVAALMEINTTDKLLLFTNKGKYLYMPVHELPDIRWKDIGQHVSNIIPIDNDEQIIKALPVRQFTQDRYLVFF